MKLTIKTLLGLLIFNAPVVAFAETLTIEGDLEVEGSLTTGQTVVRRSGGGENVYFKWAQRVPYAEVTSGYNTLANQAINIEFADVFVWGALTVTVVGDWHSAKTTGMVRKTYAIGRNPGWKNGNDGEQLEVAVGPIVDCYKLGSANSHSGKLRIPIYKISDKRNRVTVFVEGHLSVDNPNINIDPTSDISLTAWEVVAEDHVSERLVLDVESATVNGLVINPLSSYSEIATAGGLYYDIEDRDFKGHNGTGWVSLTAASGGSGSGQAYKLTTPDESRDVIVVDASGDTTVSGMLRFTAPMGDISMGAFTAQ